MGSGSSSSSARIRPTGRVPDYTAPPTFTRKSARAYNNLDEARNDPQIKNGNCSYIVQLDGSVVPFHTATPPHPSHPPTVTPLMPTIPATVPIGPPNSVTVPIPAMDIQKDIPPVQLPPPPPPPPVLPSPELPAPIVDLPSIPEAPPLLEVVPDAPPILELPAAAAADIPQAPPIGDLGMIPDAPPPPIVDVIPNLRVGAPQVRKVNKPPPVNIASELKSALDSGAKLLKPVADRRSLPPPPPSSNQPSSMMAEIQRRALARNKRREDNQLKLPSPPPPAPTQDPLNKSLDALSQNVNNAFRDNPRWEALKKQAESNESEWETGGHAPLHKPFLSRSALEQAQRQYWGTKKTLSGGRPRMRTPARIARKGGGHLRNQKLDAEYEEEEAPYYTPYASSSFHSGNRTHKSKKKKGRRVV
jgi:hypothetical protein